MANVSSSYELCPKFQKAFEILGKKWNGLILDVLVESGPKRFGQLAEKIPDVSDRVLVERLKELEKEGLIQKLSCDAQSLRMAYALTKKGMQLQETLYSLKKWSNEWIK